jgi:prepilin-type N-terminal cleavage/methylation domain-containing protein
MKRRISGVTLIELMIVIVIMSILAILGVPLTSRWIYGAQVGESESLLAQGYAQMRAVALRNPNGVASSTDAAGMKLADGTLYVCKGSPSNAACDTGGSALVWQADLSRGANIAVTLGGSTTGTIALDNMGVPRSSATARQYSISKGGESSSGLLE